MVRASALYTFAFFATALVVAVGGSAVVAWLLSRGRLPFVTTWLVTIAIVVLPTAIGSLVRFVRSRGSGTDLHRE